MAAAGGFIGQRVASAIQIGMARGVFANEAGLGSAPIAAAAARFACKASFSFNDWYFSRYVYVCTITGLVLITTGAWKSGKTGVEATTLAFQSVFGTAGSMILGIAIILFAYSTILGWSYYGENV